MSSGRDLEDARQLLMEALEVEVEVATRIADWLEASYAGPALGQSRQAVLGAAAWVAAQINALPRQQRTGLTRERLLAQVRRGDCPLCIGGSDDGGGATPSHTPVVAPPSYEGLTR